MVKSTTTGQTRPSVAGTATPTEHPTALSPSGTQALSPSVTASAASTTGLPGGGSGASFGKDIAMGDLSLGGLRHRHPSAAATPGGAAAATSPVPQSPLAAAQPQLYSSPPAAPAAGPTAATRAGMRTPSGPRAIYM